MGDDDNELEFTIPFKQKKTRFKRCDECDKRKYSTCYYHVHDTGLNCYKEFWVCKKCMKEAKERVRKNEI